MRVSFVIIRSVEECKWYDGSLPERYDPKERQIVIQASNSLPNSMPISPLNVQEMTNRSITRRREHASG